MTYVEFITRLEANQIPENTIITFIKDNAPQWHATVKGQKLYVTHNYSDVTGIPTQIAIRNILSRNEHRFEAIRSSYGDTNDRYHATITSPTLLKAKPL